MARRVFVVEDERVMAMLLQHLLERIGFEVRAVGDGQQAVALLDEPPPALLLLDIMLPYVDGAGAGRRRRQRPLGSGSFSREFEQRLRAVAQRDRQP